MHLPRHRYPTHTERCSEKTLLSNDAKEQQTFVRSLAQYSWWVSYLPSKCTSCCFILTFMKQVIRSQLSQFDPPFVHTVLFLLAARLISARHHTHWTPNLHHFLHLLQPTSTSPKGVKVFVQKWMQVPANSMKHKVVGFVFSCSVEACQELDGWTKMEIQASYCLELFNLHAAF